MGLYIDNFDVISIRIPSDKTIEECLDEGMTFKEINEVMKKKFVEVIPRKQIECKFERFINDFNRIGEIEGYSIEELSVINEDYENVEGDFDISNNHYYITLKIYNSIYNLGAQYCIEFEDLIKNPNILLIKADEMIKDIKNEIIERR